VCAPGNRAVTSISRPDSYSGLATVASSVVAATDTQLGQLRALELPGGAARGGARSVLQAMTATGEAGRGLQTAAGAKDAAAIANATRSMSVSSKDAVAKAGAFGFAACATGMQPGIESVLRGSTAVVKGAFLDKGEKLCAEATVALPDLGRTQASLDYFIRQGIQILDKLSVELKAMPVPPGDETTVTEMFAALDKSNEKVRELGGALAAQDLPRMNAIEKEFKVLDNAVRAKFEAYGIRGCDLA